MSAPSSMQTKHVTRKLPHVTSLFWIVKIVAVTLGETSGDLLGITLKIGYVAIKLIFITFFWSSW